MLHLYLTCPIGWVLINPCSSGHVYVQKPFSHPREFLLSLFVLTRTTGYDNKLKGNRRSPKSIDRKRAGTVTSVFRFKAVRYNAFSVGWHGLLRPHSRFGSSSNRYYSPSNAPGFAFVPGFFRKGIYQDYKQDLQICLFVYVITLRKG